MSLDAVRARRHSTAINRIADERVRRGMSSTARSRAPAGMTLVVRDDDDGASGSPATITRLTGLQPPLNYYNLGYQSQVGYFIEKIVHASGPVLVQPSFTADDIGPNGDIVIKSIGDADDRPDDGTLDPTDPTDPTHPTDPNPPTTPTTGGTTP